MRNLLKLLIIFALLPTGCSKGEEHQKAQAPPVAQKAAKPAPPMASPAPRVEVVPSPEEKRMERLVAFVNRLSSQMTAGVKKLKERIERLEKGDEVSFRDLRDLLSLMERNLFDLIRSNPDLSVPYRDFVQSVGSFLDVYAKCIFLYSLPKDAPERPRDNRWVRKLIMAYNDVARSNNALKGQKGFVPSPAVPRDPLDPSTYARNVKKAWDADSARARKWAGSHPLVAPDAPVVPDWMRSPRKEKVLALFMKQDFDRDIGWLKKLKCRPHVGRAPKASPTCKAVASALSEMERTLGRFAEGWLDVIQELIDIEPQIPSAMEEKLNPLLRELDDTAQRISQMWVTGNQGTSRP